MERKTRNEVILAGREAGEADASHADKARFLRNDLDVAKGTQQVDKSPRKVDDRWIGASKKSLKREVATRVRQILRDETRTTAWADPQRVFRAWHVRSLTLHPSYQLPVASFQLAPFSARRATMSALRPRRHHL